MKKYKSHQYLWFTAIAIMIFGLLTLFDDEAVLDVNVHDTYYVIHNFHLAQFIAVAYFAFGLIYFSFEKLSINLITSLSRIHVSITCLAFLIYIIGMIVLTTINTERSFPLFDDLSNENVFISLIFMFVFIAQLLFLLNIIISLLKYGLQRTTRK